MDEISATPRIDPVMASERRQTVKSPQFLTVRVWESGDDVGEPCLKPTDRATNRKFADEIGRTM